MISTVWKYLIALQRQLAPLPLPTTDCTGKTVIVTGANTGLGLEAARHFAHLGTARLILACRDVAKGEAARANIAASLSNGDSSGSSGSSSSSHYDNKESKESPGARVAIPTQLEVWELDQGSFASVRAFAERAAAELDRLDHVVLNAGVYASPDGPVRVREGYEETVTFNVLGPFLLALLLLPTLRRRAGGTGRDAPTEADDDEADNNVVSLCFVSSSAHHFARFPQRHAPRIFEALRDGEDMSDRYAVTKLLVVLLARSLASALFLPTTTSPQTPRRPLIVVNTVDPGICTTEILRHQTGPTAWALWALMAAVARSAAAGALPLVCAALAGPSSRGRYLQHAGRPGLESPYVRGPDGARDQARVWSELLALLDAAVPGVAANLAGR